MELDKPDLQITLVASPRNQITPQYQYTTQQPCHTRRGRLRHVNIVSAKCQLSKTGCSTVVLCFDWSTMLAMSPIVVPVRTYRSIAMIKAPRVLRSSATTDNGRTAIAGAGWRINGLPPRRAFGRPGEEKPKQQNRSKQKNWESLTPVALLPRISSKALEGPAVMSTTCLEEWLRRGSDPGVGLERVQQTGLR